MDVAAFVAGDDELENIGKCAAIRRTVTGEGGQDFSGFEIPPLQRVVRRRRYRPAPVPRHRYRSDWP